MKQTKTLLLILGITFLFSLTFAYSLEEKQAYNYAYKNGITTMPTIEKANMGGNLTRIAMAKMLSNYAINILGLTPNTSKDCDFSDVSSNLDYQYDNGVTKSCQLGLMGVGINQFYPNGKVTRAEFGTVLSRALNAKNTSKLNQMNNANPYYSAHLKYLNEQGIMNNISNPGSLELRGRVMLMLMRSDKNYTNNNTGRDFVEEGGGFTYRSKIVAWGNGNNYRNEEYGFHLNLGETWSDCMIVHQQGLNNETNKIENETFQLICPREGLKQDTNSYIPDGYDRLVDIFIVSTDTNERILNYLADQELLRNNKYKFGFGISDASKDIFDGKVIPSDLECGKYPNCTCHQKESYQIGDFWDKVPNNYQEIGCFITSIVKDHIEVFDI